MFQKETKSVSLIVFETKLILDPDKIFGIEACLDFFFFFFLRSIPTSVSDSETF